MAKFCKLYAKLFLILFLISNLFSFDNSEFEKAKKLYRHGKYSLAIEKLMLLLNEEPGNVEVRKLLDKCWDASFKRGKAQDRERQKKEKITMKDEVEIIKDYKKRNYLKILRILKNYDREEVSQNRKIYKILKKIERKMLKYLKKEKPNDWYIYSKIWFDYKEGKLNSMRKNLKDLKNKLKDRKSKIGLTEINFFLKLLKKRTKLTQSEIYISKGNRLYNKGKYRDAISMWRRAVDLIGETDNKKKEKILKKIDKARMKLLDIRVKKDIEKGIELYQKGKVEEAVKIWKNLYNTLKGLPKYEEVKNILYGYISRGEEELKGIRAENYNKAKELYDKGLIEYYKDNLKQAISYWEEALKLAPDAKDIEEALNKAKSKLQKRKEFQNR